MLNPFKSTKIPPKVEEFTKHYLSILPKISGTTVKDREIRRLKELENELERYEEFLNTFPRIELLHPFYKTNIEILADDLDKFKICLGSLRNALNLSRKIINRYISLIRSDIEKKENMLMRQCVGRVFSVFRKRRECIDWIIDITRQLKKLQTIDPSLPTIIIAGPPNVGKSTLVGKISTAKPEVASYPFTTKEIHVGHFITDYGEIVQVIDTPGILDRPMSERNKIELKAINAIKNLEGVVIFLFDVSVFSLYSAREQLDLYNETKSLNKTVVPVLNKMDAKNDELYSEIIKGLDTKPFEISAEKGIGLEELFRHVTSLLKGVKNEVLGK
ncbi:GTP-binding protein [Sulfolobus sp. SCGC AB-777_G05]|nr:GTP-binding protein [Sulfolobus sp. SCGC AB-777_G05]